MLSISYKKSECKFFSFVHFIQCCSMEVWKVDGKVSISESRCFSFQVISPKGAAWLYYSICGIESFQVTFLLGLPLHAVCFNLGIEMLFVSRVAVSRRSSSCLFRDAMFQSRNRDAFRFKSIAKAIGDCWQQDLNPSFNLGIEMLFISSQGCTIGSVMLRSHPAGILFQSRNRDAFHFKSIPSRR